MTRELTTGEFAALTGLSPKALRLYRERGILAPVFVEPGTGYRYYDREQLQQGQIFDLLRRASVPLTELAVDFDHAAWRERLALRRFTEDFYLDVAQEVSLFEPDQLLVRSCEAPEGAWAGVHWRFGVPDDIEDQIGAFSGLAAGLPLLAQAFQDALIARGLQVSEVSWTAAPENPGPSGTRVAELIVARPTARLLSELEGQELTEDVRARSGEDVTVVSGVLPRRLEVTFFSREEEELSAVQEAALDYKRLLAFEYYLQQHQAMQIGRGPRPVLADPEGVPVAVFDVAL